MKACHMCWTCRGMRLVTTNLEELILFYSGTPTKLLVELQAIC